MKIDESAVARMSSVEVGKLVDKVEGIIEMLDEPDKIRWLQERPKNDGLRPGDQEAIDRMAEKLHQVEVAKSSEAIYDACIRQSPFYTKPTPT